MEHEAFAHFFEASMGDSIKLQRLTKLFPNSVRVFNQMLDAIIKNAEPMTVSSVNVPSGKNVDKRQKGGRTE